MQKNKKRVAITYATDDELIESYYELTGRNLGPIAMSRHHAEQLVRKALAAKRRRDLKQQLSDER